MSCSIARVRTLQSILLLLSLLEQQSIRTRLVLDRTFGKYKIINQSILYFRWLIQLFLHFCTRHHVITQGVARQRMRFVCITCHKNGVPMAYFIKVCFQQVSIFLIYGMQNLLHRIFLKFPYFFFSLWVLKDFYEKI